MRGLRDRDCGAHWRAHNLPAHVMFHDATLEDLQGISGIGTKKLEAYGSDVLRVCEAF